MWKSNHHYNLLQQGAGIRNLEVESEESDFSQEGEVSQASKWTESFQETTENLEPNGHAFLVKPRNATRSNLTHWTMSTKGRENQKNVGRIKAENALVPVYRKELRKVLLENLQWMRAMKKDSTFKKVTETQKELKDTEGFDWTELNRQNKRSMSENSYLIDSMKSSPFHKMKTRPIWML